MTTRKFLVATAATAVVVALVSVPTRAGTDPAHQNYLTFSGSVALPGTTLAAGAYVFEYALSLGSRNIVIVRTLPDRRLRWLGMTNLVERPDHGAPGVVVLSEAKRGELPRVVTWFPPESSVGNAFIY